MQEGFFIRSSSYAWSVIDEFAASVLLYGEHEFQQTMVDLPNVRKRKFT